MTLGWEHCSQWDSSEGKRVIFSRAGHEMFLSRGWISSYSSPRNRPTSNNNSCRTLTPPEGGRTFFLDFIWKTPISILSRWMYQFTKMNHNGIIVWDKKSSLKCKKKNVVTYDNSVIGKWRTSKTNLCTHRENMETVQRKVLILESNLKFCYEATVDKWGANGLCRADHTFQWSCHLSWQISRASNSDTRCTWQHPDW